METVSVIPHACPECTSRMEELAGRVSELEEENRNLHLLEDAMRRKNAWFGALLANSSEGVTLTGPGRRILRVVRGLVGFAPSEKQGALIESMVVPEDQPILLQCYQDLLHRRCRTSDFEVRAVRPDGSIQHLAGRLTDMLDDPDIQAIVANYRDVTAHKPAEWMMAEFAALAECGESSVFTEDTEGKILTWNAGARKMFGLGEDETVGRHVGMLIPAELRAAEEEARRRVMESGAAGELRIAFRDRSGAAMAVLMALTPVRDRYGRTVAILNLCRRA